MVERVTTADSEKELERIRKEKEAVREKRKSAVSEKRLSAGAGRWPVRDGPCAV